MSDNQRVKTPLDGYKSDNVNIDYLNDLEPGEAESLIGKTISRVHGTEGELILFFTDGTRLRMNGWRFGDCSMGIELLPYEKEPQK